MEETYSANHYFSEEYNFKDLDSSCEYKTKKKP